MIAALSCVGLGLGPGCSSSASPSTLRAELEDIDRASGELHDHAKDAVMMFAYDTLFAATDLRDARGQELESLFSATYEVTYYTRSPRYLHTMTQILARLEQQAIASNEDYRRMYEVLLGARMFDDAEALARKHPGPALQPVPAHRDADGFVAGQPAEWIFDPSGQNIVRQNADQSRSAQVLVVSSPLCHFSQEALREIDADPTLSSIFRANAVWLAPQNGHIDFSSLRAWSRSHPEQHMAMVDVRDAWPIIDRWGTPTFYFLKDGQLRAQVVGWHRKQAESALHDIGLL